MLFISFDFGTKNIGVAIGQKITNTASFLQNIKVKNGSPNWKVVEKILLEWQPIFIIIGYPLNLNGSKQKITKKVEKFAHIITKQFKIPIIFHDERLTTVEAKALLFKKHGYKSLSKKNVDSLSAVIILESWLSLH